MVGDVADPDESEGEAIFDGDGEVGGGDGLTVAVNGVVGLMKGLRKTGRPPGVAFL